MPTHQNLVFECTCSWYSLIGILPQTLHASKDRKIAYLIEYLAFSPATMARRLGSSGDLARLSSQG